VGGLEWKLGKRQNALFGQVRQDLIEIDNFKCEMVKPRACAERGILPRFREKMMVGQLDRSLLQVKKGVFYNPFSAFQ